MTYPLCLLGILCFRHPLPYTVCVNQGPLRKLEQDPEFGEDIKSRKLFWLFFRPERVA